MEKETKADFTINNDEIEKVTNRIHELRSALESTTDKEEEAKIQDEMLCLIEIKRILYTANIIYKPEEFILIDEMRIKKSDYDQFFEMMSRVNIEGLDIVKPLRDGDFLPGTGNKIKVPRDIKDNEDIDAYEDYLFDFYRKNGYNIPEREFVPGTNVYKVRAPYVHECYKMKLTNDGWAISIADASKNPYYRRMKKYYEKKAEEALNDINSKKVEKEVGTSIDINNKKSTTEIFRGAYVSNLPKQPSKVVSIETIPMNLQYFSANKTIMDTIAEEGKRIYQEPNDDEIQLDILEDSLLANPTFTGQRIKRSILATKPFLDHARDVLKRKNNELAIQAADRFKVMFSSENITLAKKAREILKDSEPQLQPSNKGADTKATQLEQENTTYYSIVDEKFRIFDNAMEKAVDITDRKSIESPLPNDILVALGLNAYILNDSVTVTPDYISSVIDSNNHISTIHPRFADKFTQLSVAINQKKKKIEAMQIQSGLMESYVPFDFDEEKGMKIK